MQRSRFANTSALLCVLVLACSGKNGAPSASSDPQQEGGSAASPPIGGSGPGASGTVTGATSTNRSGAGGAAGTALNSGADSSGGTRGNSNALADSGITNETRGGNAPSAVPGAGSTKGTADGSNRQAGGTNSASSGVGTAGFSNQGAGGTTAAGPFEAISTAASCRKVKNLLVGLACTDADLATINQKGVAGLKTLIGTWMTDATFKPYFQDKMIGFFRNAYQQTGFVPTEDFKPQLLENGGFDFGPLGAGAVGDDAFARMVKNLQDSIALTAWQTVAEGRPLTDLLTTKRFMMTTALKSLYLQIETPNDQPYSFAVSSANKLQWKIEYSNRDIPLTDSINPSSPDYMVFSDVPPVAASRAFLTPTCQGDGTVRTFSGYAQLFQRLLGMTPRYPYAASPQCWEHQAKPYYTTNDLTDWQWVTIRPLNGGEKPIQPYDLPTLRSTSILPLNLPRMGFFTSPAFLALWHTNNSNDHRVTANQTLIVSTGQTFTPDSLVIPTSTAGIDSAHTTTAGSCYGCHKNLDPLRQFWANQFDFNDRNDFLTSNFFGGIPNPRPSTTGGTLAWDDVNRTGANLYDIGTLLTQVNDTTDPNLAISRYAMAIAQQLCFYANSGSCEESDPEYRRVASAFENSSYNFATLITELFASALVTAASNTETFVSDGLIISVSRRDHLCASLSNRLGIADICAQAVPMPNTTQSATLKAAQAVAADAFSRGSTTPVTPAKMTLFYRAGTEALCENVAALVVDATGSLYQSSNSKPAIDSMVQNIMGYSASDVHYSSATDILTRHYNDAQNSTNKATKTNALRSTFSLACQSPASLGIGM